MTKPRLNKTISALDHPSNYELDTGITSIRIELVKLMNNLHISGKELARQLILQGEDVGEIYVNRVRSGRVYPSYDLSKKIAYILGGNVETLFPEWVGIPEEIRPLLHKEKICPREPKSGYRGARGHKNVMLKKIVSALDLQNMINNIGNEEVKDDTTTNK